MGEATDRKTLPSHQGPSPCSKLPMPSPSAGGWIDLWGGGGVVVDCVHQPAQKTTQPLGTGLWNPPLTTALFSSAGLHCTLPFPGLKAGKLIRAEGRGARNGQADDSEPRPRPLRTTYTVGKVTVLALSATSRPFTPQPPSPVSPPPNSLPYPTV